MPDFAQAEFLGNGLRALVDCSIASGFAKEVIPQAMAGHSANDSAVLAHGIRPEGKAGRLKRCRIIVQLCSSSQGPCLSIMHFDYTFSGLFYYNRRSRKRLLLSPWACRGMFVYHVYPSLFKNLIKEEKWIKL